MAVLQVTTTYYPESDGKPMGETDRHIQAIIRHREILLQYFAGQKVYVSGNLLVYYEQGNPKKFVVPDTFVAKGLEQRERRTFKTWVERKVPDVVIETTSRKTRKKDLFEKPALYAKLGVKEYFLFDPDSEYLDPPLQGYRSSLDGFEPMFPDESGGLVSDELGLRLNAENGLVQFYRLETGERLLTEAEGRAVEAEGRAAEAEGRAVEAMARAAEARARAIEARARAAAEARAEAAEAEVAKLREELARRSVQN